MQLMNLLSTGSKFKRGATEEERPWFSTTSHQLASDKRSILHGTFVAPTSHNPGSTMRQVQWEHTRCSITGCSIEKELTNLYLQIDK